MTHDGGIEGAARRALLALARGAIVAESALRESSPGGRPSPPPPDPSSPAIQPAILPDILPTILEERRGAFVTLTLDARLRGCIGRVEPDQALRSMIPAVACLAAFADPRFPPLGTTELLALVIEISLLSPPVPVVDPRDVVVGRHGLSIASRGRRGLLLPQVAIQYAWSREEFLDQVCVKAGLHAGAWREPGASLQSFTAEVFSEGEE
jgi:AmmeMemoRadiSam system protein A